MLLRILCMANSPGSPYQREDMRTLSLGAGEFSGCERVPRKRGRLPGERRQVQAVAESDTSAGRPARRSYCKQWPPEGGGRGSSETIVTTDRNEENTQGTTANHTKVSGNS